MIIEQYLDDNEVDILTGMILKESSDSTIMSNPKGLKSDIEWALSDYENLGRGHSSHNKLASLNAWELQYDPENTFSIGNNIKGGI